MLLEFMKSLFTGFESLAQSGKRGFGLIALEQSTRQGPGTGKKPDASTVGH